MYISLAVWLTVHIVDCFLHPPDVNSLFALAIGLRQGFVLAVSSSHVFSQQQTINLSVSLCVPVMMSGSFSYKEYLPELFQATIMLVTMYTKYSLLIDPSLLLYRYQHCIYTCQM